MHHKVADAEAQRNPSDVVGDSSMCNALLAAMRLWEAETRASREVEERRCSRLREILNAPREDDFPNA